MVNAWTSGVNAIGKSQTRKQQIGSSKAKTSACRAVRGSAKRGHRRERRVDLDAAHEIKRHVQRLVVPGIKRNVGLRARLLLAITFEVTQQGRFTAQVVTSLELLRHVLQHFDVGSDALGLD